MCTCSGDLVTAGSRPGLGGSEPGGAICPGVEMGRLFLSHPGRNSVWHCLPGEQSSLRLQVLIRSLVTGDSERRKCPGTRRALGEHSWGWRYLPIPLSFLGPEDAAGLPSLSPGVCVIGPFLVLRGGQRAWGASPSGPLGLPWAGSTVALKHLAFWVRSAQQWCWCACHLLTCLSPAAHLSLPSSHTSADSPPPVPCRGTCLSHTHLHCSLVTGLSQTLPYLPEVTCHTPVTGTCATQLASHFCATASGLSVPGPPSALQTLRVGLEPRERHFSSQTFTHPPSIPNCFENSLFHLSQQC